MQTEADIIEAFVESIADASCHAAMADDLSPVGAILTFTVLAMSTFALMGITLARAPLAWWLGTTTKGVDEDILW